ncbi:MAG TPA: hypothetical protein VIL37_03620 [Natronosporangium sp.]
MSTVFRVYLPATLPALARLHVDGQVTIPQGYAAPPDPDDEERSYQAYRRAADASIRSLRADPGAPPRRVVISADVPAVPAGDGTVRLTGPVPRSAVAAIHVDGADAEPAVAAAVAGEPAGAEADEHELEWYDVSELPGLVG